ncbi:MAG: prolipoprotein diacylglyceryl transferase [Acidobacteriota bacterium]|nr:MAG: prolipoprotein diacylglyceryl transferase [Acidobacteriota bacterium]
MYPILYDFGIDITLFGTTRPLVIGSYGVVFALSLLVGGLLVSYLGRQRYADAPWLDLYLWTVVAGFIGAKVFNAIIMLPHLLAGRGSLMGMALGGGVWLGGALAGVGACWFLCRRYRLQLGVVVDVFFAVVPLVHGIGRIGCLLGGCCFGSECSLPWAITYTSPLARAFNDTPLGVPLHPAPVYEVLLEMINFAICFSVWRRRPAPWTVTALWCGLYGVERFALEFLRADPRGSFGPFSTSQWISLGLVAAATVYFVAVARRGDREPSDRREEPVAEA